MSRGKTLARRSMGGGALVTAAVVASSPQTVLNGGIPAMYGQLGVPGVPLAYLVVMGMLLAAAVGYVAVSRHIPHGAPFYAQLAHGFGPAAALVAAGVAFVGYTALQASLFPLLGHTMVGLFGGAWWWWAAGAWLLALGLGQYPGALNARVFGVLLALEIAVVLLFNAAGFTHPKGGRLTLLPFAPSSLLVAGAFAGVIVFAVASFAGVESVLAWAEEAKDHQALGRAGLGSFVLCGVLYCSSAWAYGGWIGFGSLDTALDDAAQPLVLLGDVFGPGIADLATLLLVTSVLAAIISIGGTAARYVFALARESVLPARWATISRGPKGGAPVGGAWVQAITSAVVLIVFGACGADPMLTMFPWLSTIGAFAILPLLTASSWSARSFFEKGLGDRESLWVRQVLPFAGGILGVLGVVFMASSLDKLLGTAPGSRLPWLVAAPIGVFAAAGLVRGSWLRHARLDVYAKIGRGVPDPATALEDDLAVIEV